jgi:hypothetical protein
VTSGDSSSRTPVHTRLSSVTGVMVMVMVMVMDGPVCTQSQGGKKKKKKKSRENMQIEKATQREREREQKSRRGLLAVLKCSDPQRGWVGCVWLCLSVFSLRQLSASSNVLVCGP